MGLKYNSIEQHVTPRPRSKRLREVSGGAVVTGQGTSSVEGGLGDGHTHANLKDLDKISFDDEKYLYVTQRENDELVKDKAKCGTADNLSAESTDWGKILRKDINDRTDHSLSIGKDLTVECKATISELMATAMSSATATISDLTATALKATSATISGALTAATVSATTMNATTFIGELQGNAATATKLKTARTIWGQNFDGSGNVSGRLSLDDSSVYWKEPRYGDQFAIVPSFNGTDNANILCFQSAVGDAGTTPSLSTKMVIAGQSGNVGIGTTSPAYKLDVNGTFHASGAATLDSGLTVTGNILATGNVGIGTTTPQYKLDVNGTLHAAGAVTLSSTLTAAGLITANGGTHTTALTATALSTLAAIDILGDAQLSARVMSPDYVSQTTGWGITRAGAADFRNLYADELRVQAFTADISQALAGSDYLTKSVSKLSANFVVPAVNSTVRIIVDDIEGMPATQCFSNNDYIRFRAFNRTSGLTIANVWGTVILDTTFGANGFSNGTQAYTFTCKQTTGAGLTVFKGSEVLDYGTSGSGLIQRTTLDAAGSPYMDIDTWANDPSVGSNLTTHVRLGNLGGIASCSGYGLYSDNVFLTKNILIGDFTKAGNYLSFDTQNGLQIKLGGARVATTSDISSSIIAAASYTDSQVSILNNALSAKVSQVDFNALGQRLTTAETNITANSNSISAQATNISNLTGRISTAEAKITPDAINLTVKSQVDTSYNNAVSVAAADATTKANESSGLNKWILSKYVDSSLPYGEDVSLETLLKLTPVSIIEDTDPGTSTFNQIQGFSFNADFYVGKATTYIYFSADTDISHNLISDDAGRVYINGSLIGKLGSCVNTPFTLPFKKGWNRVDLIWSEGGGGDGFSLSGLVLSTYANVIKMTAYPKGELESLISKTYTDSQFKVASDLISSKVSQTDYTGNSIASLINQTVTTVAIQASKINLVGAVTFNSLDNSTQNTINAKADTSTVNTQVNNAIGTSATDATNKVNAAIGLNKWILKKYSYSTTSGMIPTFALINNLIPDFTEEKDDALAFSASPNNNGYDSYIGIVTTYLYCNADYTYTASNIAHDDGGSIYVNGSLVYSNGFCSSSNSVSLPFKKGWNRIDLLWAEEYGDDFFSISHLFSQDSNITKMAAYPNVDTINPYSIAYANATQLSAQTYAIDNCVQVGLSNAPDAIKNQVLAAAHGNFSYIDGSSIYTGTLNANQVTAGYISSDRIAANAITADKIAANTITGGKINATSVSAAISTVISLDANRITTGTLSADRIDVVNVVANGIAARTIDAQSATISNLNVVNATVNGYFHAEYSGGAFVRMGQPTSSKILDIRADNLTGMYIGVYGDNSTGLSITANGNSNGALDIHGSSYLITRQASTSEGTWINGLSLCRVTITSGGDLGFGSLGWYQNGGYYMPNLIVSKASSNISVYIPSDMPDGAVLVFRAAGDGTINVRSRNFADQFQWRAQWNNWYRPYAPVVPGALCIMVYDKASHTWYSHNIS